MSQLEIYVDGGSRGNPGYSACAFSASIDGKKVFEKAFFLGVCTNNQAEYLGVINVLTWLVETKQNILTTINLDSELVARQLQGKYKIKDETLNKLFVIAKNLERKLDCPIVYKSIPREQNDAPDQLLNDLLNHMIS